MPLYWLQQGGCMCLGQIVEAWFWLPKGKGEGNALKRQGMHFLPRLCSSSGVLNRVLLILGFPVPWLMTEKGHLYFSSCPSSENNCVIYLPQPKDLWAVEGKCCPNFFVILASFLVHETATYRCDDTRGCVMQFWPPDDEHMCSKHVEAWNKTYCETNFVHQVG